MFVSVKFGVMRSPSGVFLGLDGRPDAVKNFASYSLQRLGIEVIDLYQPARIDPKVPIEDTIGAIADLVKEGKVRYLGLSEARPEEIRRAHKIHPVTALEMEYSLGSRSIEKEILATVRELGIGVVAFGVAGHGLLTGAIKGPLPSEDARNMFPRFQGENLKKNLEKAAFLERMATDKNCSPTQLAIAWVLSRGEDIVALVGMSHKSQVEENLKGLVIKLTADDLSDIEQAFPMDSFVETGAPPPNRKAKIARTKFVDEDSSEG